MNWKAVYASSDGEETDMALPGMYGSFLHERQVDKDLMAGMRPKAVVVMDPTASKVAKIWQLVKDQNAYIILRKWEWDDNRTQQNPEGIYKELWADPIGLGKRQALQWSTFVVELYRSANSQNLAMPSSSRLICHLINEPDTNGADKQLAINRYTLSALAKIKELNRIYIPAYLGCFNFGTGHPAELKDGKPNWEPFKTSLDLIRNTGHWVLLHEYYNSYGITNPDTNPWHVFRHHWAPLQDGYSVGIAEWGCEELVNNVMDRNHGWQGKLSASQYAADYYWYCTHCNDFVQWVSIFASDTPGWETFDPAPAKDDLIKTANALWKEQGQKPPIEPPIEPPVTEKLIVPCKGTVTQRFGEDGHNGIDIANVEKTNILAIADGTVEWVGWDEAYGSYIRIYHPQYHCHSFYAHLSFISVEGGQNVGVGQVIGLMGSTGNSTGPHLHFEIRMGEKYSYWDVTWGHFKGRSNPEVLYALILGRDVFE